MSTERMTQRLPECLRGGDDERARGYLQTYYGTSGGRPYTGSYFDTWAVDQQDPDRITADDLIAVSFLSVFVPPLAARELLDTQAARFADLLAAVGPDRDLGDESAPIDEDWPASRFYGAVRQLDGVGRTIASKLCARKRPRLLPIYDSVVAKVTNVGDYHWEPLRLALRADEESLTRRLEELRDSAGVPEEVSVLRIYDVIAWMEGKDKNLRPTGPEETLGAALAGPDGVVEGHDFPA